MADTIDLTEGGNDVMPVVDAGYNFSVESVWVDCAVTNRAATNILQLINIPADTLVERVAVVVDTIEDSTLTIDVGDGTDPDGFIDGADMESLLTKITVLALAEATPNTVVGYSNGKLYTAADTIDVIINDAADTVKFKIVAICKRLKKAAAQNNALGST